MMDSLDSQVADIERELLALTANQPPNIRQLSIFKVVRVALVDNEIKTIAFNDGLPRFTQAYSLSDTYAQILFESGVLKVRLNGYAGDTYAVVSLGAFDLV